MVGDGRKVSFNRQSISLFGPLAFLLIMALNLARADTLNLNLTQQSNCEIDSPGSVVASSVTQTGNCSVSFASNLGNGSASGSSSASVALVAPNALALTGGASATATAGGSVFASGSSGSALTGYLFFDGPLRQGFVDILDYSHGDGYSGLASDQVVFGGQVLSSCTSIMLPSPCATSRIGGLLLPIMIGGGPQLLSYAMSGEAAGAGGGNTFDVLYGSSVTLKFFEADQITPVSLQDVPEPQGWALLGSGLSFVGALRLSRKPMANL